jgi:hypothetical protein
VRQTNLLIPILKKFFRFDLSGQKSYHGSIIFALKLLWEISLTRFFLSLRTAGAFFYLPPFFTEE